MVKLTAIFYSVTIKAAAKIGLEMQNPNLALMRIIAASAAAATLLLLGRAADAEVSLEDMMHNYLLLENFWAPKSTQEKSNFPNDGSAVCFGYLLAFRGLHGAVIGTDCLPAQSCRRTQRFCIPEKTSDMQILSAFLGYAGGHIGHGTRERLSTTCALCKMPFRARTKENKSSPLDAY